MSTPTQASVERSHERLLKDVAKLEWLRQERGITQSAIKLARLGFERGRFTIPVYVDGELVNIRLYKANATETDAKVLSVNGCGTPRWYLPFGAGDGAEPVLAVEGELDALLAAQKLRAARIEVVVATGTGGAGNVPADMGPLSGRDVYIAYDCDEAGRSGARRLAQALSSVAASVRIVDLGLGHGEDVTDWFVTHGRSAKKLWKLARQAQPLPSDETGLPRRDADELVETAVTEKCDEEGSRNAAGLWLACQLRDERYSSTEAEPHMEAFQSRVTGDKAEPYTRDEAMRTLANAYSRPPRDALGGQREYGWDDTGNGERLVDQHGDDMRYIAAYKGWHVWDARRWVRDETGVVERWAKETARHIKHEGFELRKSDEKAGDALVRWGTQSANRSKLTAMAESARSEPGLSVVASAFDADPSILVCRNGVVALGNDGASFREHRRDDYARLLTNVDYRADAASATWTRFLAEALPDPDVRRYLQALAGYSLQGGNPERLLIFVQGPTSTGKTTFVQSLAGVLGDYAGTFDLTLLRAKQDESPRADIVDVINKRLVFTSEAVHEWRLHADVIKRVTGGDTIKARLPHAGSFVEKVPDFTPWIATNSAPEIPGADKALWRRLTVVPFTTPPAREDRQLQRTILESEASGVLGWAVEGWNLYRNGVLEEPPLAVVEATMSQREALSHVDSFLAECCDSDAEYWTPFDDLWQAYSAWTSEGEVAPRDRLAKNQLGPALEGRGLEPKQRRVGDRNDDRKVRGYRGLRLAKGWAQAYG